MADQRAVTIQEDLLGVYDEDVIQSKDKKKIGIVLKTARDDYSSESSDEEDDEDEKVEKGKVMVGWYSLHSKWDDSDDVAVVDENSIELVDRSLLPGDVVRRVNKDEKKEKGQIMDVDVAVDIRIMGTNHILKNVDSKDLKLIKIFDVGMDVVKGPWLGVINGVNLEVTLRLKNGSRCIMKGEAIENLIDITDQREEDSTFYCDGFYPGQKIQGSARAFKDAKWIAGSRPAVGNHVKVKAIVEEVVTESLTVDWHICGYTGKSDDNMSVQPSPVVVRKELNSGALTVLNHFKKAHMQIGDKCYYVLKDSDVAQCKQASTSKKEKQESAASSMRMNEDDGDDEEEDEEDSDYDTEGNEATRDTRANVATARRGAPRNRRKRKAHVHKKKKRYQPPAVILPGSEVCVEICHTKTISSTKWQNGEESERVVSNDLCPVIHLDELEFFPGDFVVDKRDSENGNTFGVVTSSDVEGRLVNVQWLAYNGDAMVQERLEEGVSVYDIEDHKDYTFRIGDIVVRLAVDNQLMNETASASNSNSSVIQFSPAGMVLRVDTLGMILIQWADATVSSVLPTQVFLFAVMNDGDDEVNSSGYSDENADEDGDEWETASENSDDAPNEDIIQNLLNPLEDVIMRSLAALNTTNSGGDQPGQNILEINSRTTEFISELDQQFLNRNENANHDADADGAKTESAESADINMTSDGAKGDTQSADANGAQTAMECEETLGSYTTVENVPACHRFHGQCAFTPTNQRIFNSALMKDIKLLKSHLPSGIFVKSFEDKMNLFSVLIVGPEGTPYEGGLFLFDLRLPENYPASPPIVHYHSFCSSRLNPNLYEDGKVCVSLLGTWTGKGSETWTSKSTIHQVLLSIQGLILCEEPYFNEAGYENHRGSTEGLENSRLYNEMAIIKMMQSIQKMISRPPELFQDEALKHFKEELPKIFSRIDSWISEDPTIPPPPYPLFPLSKGFLASVTRVLSDLKKTFNELNAT